VLVGFDDSSSLVVEIVEEEGLEVEILDLEEDRVVNHLSEGSSGDGARIRGSESVGSIVEMRAGGDATNAEQVVLQEGGSHGRGEVDHTGPGGETGGELLGEVGGVAVHKEVHGGVRGINQSVDWGKEVGELEVGIVELVANVSVVLGDAVNLLVALGRGVRGGVLHALESSLDSKRSISSSASAELGISNGGGGGIVGDDGITISLDEASNDTTGLLGKSSRIVNSKGK